MRQAWVRSLRWAEDRWLSVTLCVLGAACAVSMLVGGIVLLAVDPPPVGVWILAAAYGFVQLWCSRKSGESDEPEDGDADYEFESAAPWSAAD